MSDMKDTDVLSHIESLTIERLDLYIGQGWVDPVPDPNDRRFTDIDIARLQLIEQLRNELAVNDEAVPVVLSLLDQVHGLRHQLRCLAQVVEQQQDDVRQRITAAFHDAVK